jgi:thioredoxin 1
MLKIRTIALTFATLAGVVLLLVLQFGQSPSPANPGVTAPTSQPGGLPRLVDLGAKTCIPCKKMAPILEELKKEYAGRMDVEFIDVWLKENVPLATQYGIRVIPTQVFLDAAGKELWRHEGFISKEDILAKWKELKIDLAAASPTTAPATAPERVESTRP